MADLLVIGCGYLGRRVADLGRAAGQRVFATTRSPPHAAEFQRLGLEPVLCDVIDPDSLLALPAGVDVVYCVGFDRAGGADMRAVFVDGLANVLDALEEIGRLVYVSSTGVYAQRDGEAVDENAATQPTSESGRVVLEAERLLRGERPDAVILRFAGIYGPGRLIREQALRAGDALSGDPEQWLNLIHVEDGAVAVTAAARNGAAGRRVQRLRRPAGAAARLLRPHGRGAADAAAVVPVAAGGPPRGPGKSPNRQPADAGGARRDAALSELHGRFGGVGGIDGIGCRSFQRLSGAFLSTSLAALSTQMRWRATWIMLRSRSGRFCLSI